MSTFVLLTITGLGLGAMYFLIASGPLADLRADGRPQLRARRVPHRRRLRDVVHGDEARAAIPVWPRFLLAALVGLVVGTVFAALVELVLIRPLYGRHIEQVLVTVGLALAIDRARRRRSGATTPSPSRRRRGSARRRRCSVRTSRTTAGSRSPTAVVVLVALNAFLRRTRYGLIVRAGRREPRDGDRARHRRAPRVHARLRDRRCSRRRSPACSRTSTSARSTRSAARRSLIFAFIVVVIGGLGSLRGTALAAVVVGLVQQYANYYAVVRASAT